MDPLQCLEDDDFLKYDAQEERTSSAPKPDWPASDIGTKRSSSWEQAWEDDNKTEEANTLLQAIIECATLRSLADDKKMMNDAPVHQDSCYSDMPSLPMGSPYKSIAEVSSDTANLSKHTTPQKYNPDCCCNLAHEESDDGGLCLNLSDLTDDEFDLLSYTDCEANLCFAQNESTMNILLEELSQPACDSPRTATPTCELKHCLEWEFASKLPYSFESTFTPQPEPNPTSQAQKVHEKYTTAFPKAVCQDRSFSSEYTVSQQPEPRVRFPKLKQHLLMASMMKHQQQTNPFHSNNYSMSPSSHISPTDSQPQASGQTTPKSPSKTQFVKMRERPRGSDLSQPDNFLSYPIPPEYESEVHFTKIKPRPRGNVQDVCFPQHGLEGSSPPNDNTNPESVERQPRRDADEPRRPKNGFIRFSIEHRAELLHKYPFKDNRMISKLLGFRWKKMTPEEKRPYEEEFSKDIHEIRSQNPQWRYAPAKQSSEELVEPMEKRLRPRQKLRTKSVDWEFTEKDAKPQTDYFTKRQPSTRQGCTNKWQRCDFCSQWCASDGPFHSTQRSPTWCPISQTCQVDRPQHHLLNVHHTHTDSIPSSAALHSINIPSSLNTSGFTTQIIQLPFQQTPDQTGGSLQSSVIVVLPAYSTITTAPNSVTNPICFC